MATANEPLVSVVTPVYNGAKYLRECIESVLAQRYRNWEYLIVNNCSTDETSQIAEYYAERDNRIRVITNPCFVGVIENHNIAFRSICDASSYCKVVSADDYLFPECIPSLVERAEQFPRAAVVGSYAISDHWIRRIELPVNQCLFTGREVCRLYLLGRIGSFGTPSSVLYRSTLLKGRESFYPGRLPNADLAACLECLEGRDFGFVHQILSYERVHEEAASTSLRGVNSFLIDRLQFIHQYGTLYLEQCEMEALIRKVSTSCYRGMAHDAINLRWQRSWNYHRSRFEAMGFRVNRLRMATAICAKGIDLLLNPKQTIERVSRRARAA
jgi:glycosyltransferase involved in cell wall biosynthesis